MKHDEIAMSLDDEKLNLLLHPFFGRKGVWSPINFDFSKEVEEWTFNNVGETKIINMCDDSLKNVRNVLINSHNEIEKTPISESLQIEKTFEFPLIKGEGKYRCTKGFIDLIVHAFPKECNKHYCYDDCAKEFVIEIKKEADFNDVGAILRQIKEYREYYSGSGVKRFDSRFAIRIDRSYYSSNSFYFCVLADKIPEKAVKFLEGEGIKCFQLCDLEK